MSRVFDRTYHQTRAEEELKRAEEASDPAVARLHRELAALHRRQMMTMIEVDRVLPPMTD